MIRSLLRLFFTLLGLAAAASRAAEASILGKAPTLVMPLAPQLESAGCKVATPAMPWSGLREYDAGYPQALAEIEAAAQSLREQRAKRIVVAGQSFGGNGALAYAASGRAVDAIVVLSPGHTPERGQFRKALERSVDKAARCGPRASGPARPGSMTATSADGMAGVAEASILRKAPPHEKSKDLVVPADHLSVVDVIGPELIGRLQAL